MSALNQVDTLIETVAREFKASVKAALLKRLQDDLAPELEQIATAEAERIHSCIVDYWKDQRLMVDWLGLRLQINGVEVKRVEPA